MLERLVDMLAGRSLGAGYAFVFAVLLLCGFGLPMPEDIILVAGGVLAWLSSDLHTATLPRMLRDRGFLTMVAVGLGGILAGDSAIFLMGRRFGARVADFRPLRRVVTPEKLERVEKRIRRYGNVVVLLARFLPGLRAPTFFTVGHARMPFWEFLLFDGVAALVSAPLWVAVGFYFGSDIHQAARAASRFGHYILAGAIAVVGALLIRWIQARRAARARAAAAAPAEDQGGPD
ncbi:MAG TPA: DedA family protein [Anaeromyxobacteraceae bacterium]|nr:DedA family protein [Anaeromyxobacteraceae bacterium]